MKNNFKVISMDRNERKKLQDNYFTAEQAAANDGGDQLMGENKFVTYQEFNNLKELMNHKIDSLNNEIDLRFKNVIDKIESNKKEIIYEIKDMFHIQSEKQNEAKKQTIQWIIGTGIAAVGLALTFVKYFM